MPVLSTGDMNPGEASAAEQAVADTREMLSTQIDSASAALEERMQRAMNGMRRIMEEQFEE
eukprot:4048604-Pyramimonas_sp.AAC.1